MPASRLLLFQEENDTFVELYTFIRVDSTFKDEIQTSKHSDAGTVVVRKLECVESTLVCASAYTPSRGFVCVIRGRDGLIYLLQNLENVDLFLTQEHKDRLQKEFFIKF